MRELYHTRTVVVKRNPLLAKDLGVLIGVLMGYCCEVCYGGGFVQTHTKIMGYSGDGCVLSGYWPIVPHSFPIIANVAPGE